MEFLVGMFLGALFVTPLVLSYALFIRWVDRFEPEPWWLLIAAFIWGALFATLGGGTFSAIAPVISTRHSAASSFTSDAGHSKTNSS